MKRVYRRNTGRNIVRMSFIVDQKNSNKIENCSCDNCNINKELVQFDLTNEIKILLKTVYYTKEIFGIFILRPLMEKSSMSNLIIILSLAGFLFILPSIAMFYGFHEFTEKITNGIVKIWIYVKKRSRILGTLYR